MALRAKSLFNYGLQVTALNRSLDFYVAPDVAEKQTTLRLGYYSVDTLIDEIIRAMNELYPTKVFTGVVDRTVGAGLQNRITLATTSASFALLFGTGTRKDSSIASLIGFPATDKTGSASYIGNATSGTILIPNANDSNPYTWGYSFSFPEIDKRNFGSVNLSASGLKESITFQLQEFWQVGFRYLPRSEVATSWVNFISWMIQQRPIEFTPEINAPTIYYDGTLEGTEADAKGLAFKFKEMLPSFPNFYDTGIMRFRRRIVNPTFI